MHKEQPKKGRLPRHILPIARSKRNAMYAAQLATVAFIARSFALRSRSSSPYPIFFFRHSCECGTAKFDGAKQEECMVGTDSKSNLAWLNAPDRSFTLEYCTDKCTENHRVKPGHCWDDEDELVSCIYCRTDFHADCVVRAPLIA